MTARRDMALYVSVHESHQTVPFYRRYPYGTGFVTGHARGEVVSNKEVFYCHVDPSVLTES